MNQSKRMVRRNPFKGFQDSTVSARKTAIEAYLKVVRRTRAKYQYVTDLAKAVAEQLTLVEGWPCDYSTLLRNPKYKALLLDYMASASGAQQGLSQLGPVAEANLSALTLEVGNLKKENSRLRAYVLELEMKVDSVPRLEIEKEALIPTESSHQMTLALENELAMANKALWLVLDWQKELIAVDRERECIIDLTALRHKNVIVDQPTARPFVSWMRKNSGIG